MRFLVLCGLAILAMVAPNSAAQGGDSTIEIPLERCGPLPIVILRVDKADRRFLVDTAATSMLNARSFAGQGTKEVRIQSWNQITSLNASDVSIGELSLGNHIVRNIGLPAVDLSAISKACGDRLDGILGVDLLERLEVTIDFKHHVARLGAANTANSPGSRILTESSHR